MKGYIYKLENFRATGGPDEDWGPLIAVLEGDENEDIERKFGELYDSNDYALSYSPAES